MGQYKSKALKIDALVAAQMSVLGHTPHAQRQGPIPATASKKRKAGALTGIVHASRLP